MLDSSRDEALQKIDKRMAETRLAMKNASDQDEYSNEFSKFLYLLQNKQLLKEHATFFDVLGIEQCAKCSEGKDIYEWYPCIPVRQIHAELGVTYSG